MNSSSHLRSANTTMKEQEPLIHQTQALYVYRFVD